MPKEKCVAFDDHTELFPAISARKHGGVLLVAIRTSSSNNPCARHRPQNPTRRCVNPSNQQLPPSSPLR